MHPPRRYSLLPFWFWNDVLDEAELLRQIADFEAHGVHGFVIHPRVGLPRDTRFMSEKLLDFMQIALDEAARRDMTVLLYDEGMYPSGSASGEVVAANPEHACRGLALADPDAPVPSNVNVVLDTTVDGKPVRIVDRKVDSVIRGLHYVGEGPDEETPPAADILNPAATASFLHHVYEPFHRRFGEHFGETILGIFTDEPNPLGRVRERNVWPGTTGILPHVERLLGYDFTPHLPALFFDLPDAERYRADYKRAIRLRLEETWYEPLHDWCEQHGTNLCGHPDAGDEIGCLRYFHFPGQDVVWRWVEPGNANAIEGPESTQGKASSSAALHLGRPRNSNEFCGAFGHETTFEEFQWLANWLLVRGVNLLIPHAFYYSIRGPRVDERPPQVGPNGKWWDRFKPFADACRRLCWLNAESEHQCDVAILTSDRCPWVAAKELFEHGRDFNYLEDRLLLDGTATVHADHLAVGPMRYRVLLVEDEALLTDALRVKLEPFVERVVTGDWLRAVETHSAVPTLVEDPPPGLRVRQLRHDGTDYALLFNEAGDDLHGLPLRRPARRVDPATGDVAATATETADVPRWSLTLLRLQPAS